jgi:hypothetical protein
LDTVRDYELKFNEKWEGNTQFDQVFVENLYHHYNIKLAGVAEIRQVWTKAHNTPRTYFAAGGTTYQASKYIQGIANILTSTLRTVDPRFRTNPARILLDGDDTYLRIYDLTGFTSNHSECKYFLNELANWCYGTPVNVVDVREGVVQHDLGDLISNYNLTCNHNASFSYEKIDKSLRYGYGSHTRAGFLGVYGNISFSTYLHGACLLMSLFGEDQANVAGDDAHYVQYRGYEYYNDIFILANGTFEESKVFTSDQEGAVCLKRSVARVGDRVIPKPMIIFPSFATLGASFGFVSPQFTPPKYQQSRSLQVSIAANDIFRFLTHYYRAGDITDAATVYDVMKAYYKISRFPLYGVLPPYGEMLIPALPDTPEGLLEVSPLKLLLQNHFTGTACVPRCLSPGMVDESKGLVDIYEGLVWIGSSSKKLNLIESLGYIVKEVEYEMLMGLDAYNALIGMYEGPSFRAYRYHCLMDVPITLATLPD